MSYEIHDTIAAIATPAAGGARGVIRVSGPAAVAITLQVFRAAAGQPEVESLRVPTAILGQAQLGSALGAISAEAMIWPTTRSYTRQPTVELHTIGSAPILTAAMDRLIAAGARTAHPGEFTLRAFLAGRLDLTQAEAVLGVIDAQDRQSLDTALSQLAGGLASPLARIRGELLDLLAHLEAGLDFVEEDIEFITAEQLQADLARAATSIERLAEQMQSRSRADRHAKVAIVGQPNVGKSSLLNALAGRDAALVSPQAGATRDFVSQVIELGGIAVELIDTAGINSSAPVDGIDQSAQAVSRQQQDQAELQLFCLDGTHEPIEWEREQLALNHDSRLIVSTKLDCRDSSEATVNQWFEGSIEISSVTGEGLERLRIAIAERLAALDAESSVVAGTAVRCSESMAKAAEALRLATEASENGFGEELVASELRLALEEIGKVAGVVYTDDVLDRIFSRFCIGK